VTSVMPRSGSVALGQSPPHHSVGSMTKSDQHMVRVRNRNRLWSAAKIVMFDLAGPLAAYALLRSAGQTAVTALILSGTLPPSG